MIPKRKVVQLIHYPMWIAGVGVSPGRKFQAVIALCDDGTIWLCNERRG